MDPVEYSTKRQTLNFLDLPFEVRSCVYTLAIQASHDESPASTHKTEARLKQVSRQIYCDLFNLPQPGFVVLKVDEISTDLLRAAKDFPRPKLLSGSHPKTRGHIAPAFTALNVLRLTNLAIEVKWSGWTTKYSGSIVQKKFNSLAWILRDTDSIKRVRLIVQSDSCSNEAMVDIGIDTLMSNVLRKFVDVVASKGIKVRAEHDQWRDNHANGLWVEATGPVYYHHYDTDPIVECLNKQAELRNCLDPELKAVAPGPPAPCQTANYYEGLSEHSLAIWQSRDYIRGIPPVPMSASAAEFNSCEKCKNSNKTLPKTISNADQTPHSDCQRFPDGLMTYKLIPECRLCYHLFKTTEELHAHLASRPKHAIPYRKKPMNQIYKEASADYTHVCPNCGYGCSSERMFDVHMEKHPTHRRYGAIPRWKEDNAYYSRMWKRHFEQGGRTYERWGARRPQK